MKDYYTIKKEIESGKPDPVYFLFGEEPFFLDYLERALIESVDSDTRDFNCDILTAGENDISTILERAAEFPMMAERRLVIIRQAQRLTKSGRDRLVEYLKNPAETTCLAVRAGKIDKRQTFYKVLLRQTWFESKPLYENQAIEWVKKLFQPESTLSHEAAVLLVEQTGTSLWTLFHEAEKLKSYAWGRKELTADDVGRVSGMSRNIKPWELSDAVGSRELHRALSILKISLDEGRSPAGMIMDLTRRFFILAKLRALIDQGISARQAAQQISLNPYFSRLYLKQVEGYTMEELKSGFEMLCRADLQLKTGGMTPLTVLTLLLVSLARRKKLN
ncbi:MAG TPA: DNA polymerase III subunit delta [bacterium]|nr:DNA polymerase III subunit delta [bacterium]